MGSIADGQRNPGRKGRKRRAAQVFIYRLTVYGALCALSMVIPIMVLLGPAPGAEAARSPGWSFSLRSKSREDSPPPVSDEDGLEKTSDTDAPDRYGTRGTKKPAKTPDNIYGTRGVGTNPSGAKNTARGKGRASEKKKSRIGSAGTEDDYEYYYEEEIVESRGKGLGGGKASKGSKGSAGKAEDEEADAEAEQQQKLIPRQTRDQKLAEAATVLVKKEFMWPIGKAPFNNAHASTLVELTPGELLAAFFAGSKEGAKDVAIWSARLHLDAEVWTAPVLLVDEPGVACWNPVLFKFPDGEILLFYKVGESPETWSGFLKRSMDGGETWGDTEALPGGIVGPSKNKPIYAMEDDALFCPSSVESFQAWGSWVEVTKDRGRSWHKLGPIAVPSVPKGVIQPSIFFTNEGHLRVLMRSSRQIGQICVSSSYDAGFTWTPAKSLAPAIPNPNCGFDVVRLSDGHIVMVHNTKSRGHLVVKVSDDDGETWREVATLENGSSGEYSYAAVIQTADNLVHTTYTYNRKTIKHVVLNPEEF